MSTPKIYPVLLFFIGTFITLTLFLAPTPAQARIPLQSNDGSQCVTCHEDLYYLHDTGKAYCLKDAPMACVDCHGGDPTALTKEAAHFNRAAHPVINDDDKKCYECHPAEANSRLDKFRQVAGIKEVKTAVAYTPASAPVSTGFPESKPEEWVLGMEARSLFLVAGLALVAFIAFKIRH